ncbi:MAG: class I SAM-dependent methyltransferase [archaeon]
MAKNEDYRWQFGAKNPLRIYEREILIKSISGKKVLDIGGGVGRLANELQSSGHDVTVLEYDSELLKKGKENFQDIRFMQGSVYEIPFKDDTFDEVIMEQVLEHLQDHNEAVKECLRVLKKGGTLTISTPNKYIYRIYIFFCRVAELKILKLFSHVDGHICEITYNDAKILCRKNKAKIIGLNPFLKKIAMNNPLLGIDFMIKITK